MHKYFIKTPWWVKKVFSSFVWDLDRGRKEVYLTFDDGPHPEITPWVLELLKEYGAKATFFCIGNNVSKFPATYRQVIDEGHSIGNHTYHHLNGWKTEKTAYIKDVEQAATLISSSLFRPPYGKIKMEAARKLPAVLGPGAQVIMWDVLSADFDRSISKEECLHNVLSNIGNGSVVVFHDSEKAFPHLQFVLPLVLEYLKEEGYECKKIGNRES